ncbi:IucA/IucC family protein [uncultured Desulfosarcina sp.]|uniref:IucA/IucC family protein n=1 Tax=uncultured Desulfosarcina sp. TaxID=218289 RepID=UPI0029C86B43|nr:IucA/IucC family protein [uncultured Desulfosarcina sp.]
MQIPSLIYLERYRNEGTRTYSSHAATTEAREDYRPDSNRDRFDLPLFAVPREQMLVYTANPSADLSAVYLDDDKAMFAIHPQVLDACPQDPYVQRTLNLCTGRGSLPVTPSSSTRTLFAVDRQPPHALKVHFPFRVSRYDRRMRHEVLEQAINVSRELEAGIGLLDPRFAFLREVIAVCHPNLDVGSAREENWGCLIRDMRPFPATRGSTRLVPGFALYGRDFYDPETPFLLTDLIGDGDPLLFVLENIMLPIIHHWVACFLHFGYLLEPHGQNVIFEVRKDNLISRIVHRDLSVGIDMRRRRDIGLSDSQLNGYNRMEHDKFHSIVYDRFMGSHFFDRLVDVCLDHYEGLCREDFTRPCKEAFASIFPEHRKYFPATVWYFSESRDRFNKPFYEDTGLAPDWRP